MLWERVSALCPVRFARLVGRCTLGPDMFLELVPLLFAPTACFVGWCLARSLNRCWLHAWLAGAQHVPWTGALQGMFLEQVPFLVGLVSRLVGRGLARSMSRCWLHALLAGAQHVLWTGALLGMFLEQVPLLV